MIGRYELITRLATGGMAELFLARERGLGGLERLVVIKRILPHLADKPSFVEMFLREARIVARLSHPNVVQIYELGQEGNSYFIAMEYIHGSTLRELQLLAEERGLSVPHNVAATVIDQACRGLHAAHELRDLDGRPMSLVHRDISPHNLMCTTEGHVKLLDFGVAKSTEGAEATYSGNLKGKFAYLSPEQCLHRPLDRRSDVFALGIVTWELFTGQRLFKRRTELEMMQAVIGGDVPLPTTLDPTIPQPIEQVIMRALAVERDERFDSAEQMRQALAHACQQSRLEPGEDHLYGFIDRVAGAHLSERRSAVESAFERALSANERRRLLHMTGSHSHSESTRDEVSIRTVADRPAATASLERASFEGQAPERPARGASPAAAATTEAPTVAIGGLRPAAPTPSGAPPPADSGFSDAIDFAATAGRSRSARGEGVFASDVRLSGPSVSMSQSFARAGMSGVWQDHRRRVVRLGAAGFGVLLLTMLAIVFWPRATSDEATYDHEAILIGDPLPIGWAPTVDVEVLVNEVRPLHRYLERTTGRPMPMVIARDYGELTEMLRDGRVAFATLPPLLFLRTRSSVPGVEALAVKEFDGGTGSDALMLVPMNSKARTLADLEGSRFCFVDENSTTGYFLPRAYLRNHGFDPEAFIGSVHWSGDHLQALRDLTAGQCDVASIYSGAFLSADEFGIRVGQLRTFAIVGHIPQDAFSAGPAVAPADREKVRDALLAFDPREHLNVERLGDNQRITGFSEVSERDWEYLRSAVEADDARAAAAGEAAPADRAETP